MSYMHSIYVYVEAYMCVYVQHVAMYILKAPKRAHIDLNENGEISYSILLKVAGEEDQEEK